VPERFGQISGLGQRAQPWTVAANRDIVRTVIDFFGVARCMFASNFPVDSLLASRASRRSRRFAEIVREFAAQAVDRKVAREHAARNTKEVDHRTHDVAVRGDRPRLCALASPRS